MSSRSEPRCKLGHRANQAAWAAVTGVGLVWELNEVILLYLIGTIDDRTDERKGKLKICCMANDLRENCRKK